MKLLLTSAGLTTDSIGNALVKLTDKPAAEIKVAFVPTAANVEAGNKDWFLNQFTNLQRYGLRWIDIVDPSAADVDWRPRLEAADVIFVSGGNTFHLLNQARLTGFGEWLKAAVTSKVYVGVSAGSILVTPSIGVAPIDNGDENICGITDLHSLGFVDFEVSPHSPSMVSYDANAEYAASIATRLYAYDDSTAIQVIDDKITVISNGEWRLYNE